MNGVLRDVQDLLWLFSDIDVWLQSLFFIVGHVALQFSGSWDRTIQQHARWEVEGVQGNLTRKHNGSARKETKKKIESFLAVRKLK